MSSTSANARPLMIAIGNPLRGDDGAGLVLADRLGAALPVGSFDCETLDGEVSALIDAWTGRRLVIVVDAAVSGAPAGTIHRFDAIAEPLPAIFENLSTHGIGLPEAIELGRALGLLPKRLIVYAIEGSRYEPGDQVSPETEQAFEELTGRIAVDLESVIRI